VDQFELLKPSAERIFTPFDFDSVMLSGEYAFSKDGKSPTMEPRVARQEMIEVYDKLQLSRYDVESMNLLYRCRDSREPWNHLKKGSRQNSSP